MNDINTLTDQIRALLISYQSRPVLVAGDLAAACLPVTQDTRTKLLTTPYTLTQLAGMSVVEMAVISDLTETMPKQPGQQWLGLLKNMYAPHILLIVQVEAAQKNGWQFTDYIALGFEQLAQTTAGIKLFSYAIENYQPEHDWLNSRYWANPGLFDKYRW